LNVFDYSASFGGPIKRDRLWLVASTRYWGQEERIPGMYCPINPLSWVFNPRLGAAGKTHLKRPANYEQWLMSFSIRLKWQASSRKRFTFAETRQPRRQMQNLAAERSFEASADTYLTFLMMYQVTWR
jgi:hypothetical protein